VAAANKCTSIAGYFDSHGGAMVRYGRSTFGTCLGEAGLKIRPDVFRHDNGEQKKHVLLCKMSPAFRFFLFEKGKKII